MNDSGPRRTRQKGAARPSGIPQALIDFMQQGWAQQEQLNEPEHEAARNFASRRARVGRRFPGKTLVIPTGTLKVRANDCDYRFRPGSDFFWLTGSGDPDGVLVLRPTRTGHTATMYVMPRSDRSSERFFTDTHYGELWVGARRGLLENAHRYHIKTAPLTALKADLAQAAAGSVVMVRGIDPAVEALVPPSAADAELARCIGEFRLVKDAFEISMLEKAIASTVKGFEDVVRALPAAVRKGERYVEGVFNLRARVEGNDVGYDTIAAAGAHATTLHWTRNDGPVRRRELLLLDAGVESTELYTADVTRTIPVSGKFSPAQREVYELVLAAQQAGIAAVKPGVPFRAPHDAAVAVLVEGLQRMGILPDPAAALDPANMFWRRYMPHGTSHMLGLDVHDCANARNEAYVGPLRPGYVLTVEPGLYFKPDDLTVPAKYRGIGIRIEDDVLVTPTGNRVLSAALPTSPADIEKWMGKLSRRAHTLS